MFMTPIPRLPEDSDLDALVVVGLDAFASGKRLVDMQEGQRTRGWHLGWARCYGKGVKDALLAKGREVENPYPQFSGPWEAWAQGFEEAESL